MSHRDRCLVLALGPFLLVALGAAEDQEPPAPPAEEERAVVDPTGVIRLPDGWPPDDGTPIVLDPDALRWDRGRMDHRDLDHDVFALDGRAPPPEDLLDHSAGLRFGYPNAVALNYTAILDLDPAIHHKYDDITGPAATIELGPRAVKVGLGLHHGTFGIAGGTWLRPMVGYLQVIQDGAGFERDMRFLGGELYLNAVIYGLNLGLYQRLDDDDDKERIVSFGVGLGL